METAIDDPAPVLREAVQHDLSAIRAIYSHYVETGFASFEEKTPNLAEFTRRWRAATRLALPFLVAEVDGVVRGYAYAAPYRKRSAYRHTIEDSIYVDPQWQRRGIARVLIEELIARCTALGYRQMIAVIGGSDNAASITLHERSGFRQVGTFTAVGRKLGCWVDAVLMQRPLGAADGPIED